MLAGSFSIVSLAVLAAGAHVDTPSKLFALVGVYSAGYTSRFVQPASEPGSWLTFAASLMAMGVLRIWK